MTIEHVEPWIETESGVAFDLLTPRAEDVRIEDIAGHLSKINRYAGATIGAIGYTVAQHSVHVSRILETWGAPLAVQREGLLHDAPEAYYGDVSSPVQRALRVVWKRQIAEVEAIMLAAIPERFGPLDDNGAVRELVASMREALLVSDPFSELKEIVDPVVRAALGLPIKETPIVKRADLVALACERKAIMAPCDRDWRLPEYADTRWSMITIEDSSVARDRFLRRLDVLDTAIKSAP